jgi:hypothetical protein
MRIKHIPLAIVFLVSLLLFYEGLTEAIFLIHPANWAANPGHYSLHPLSVILVPLELALPFLLIATHKGHKISTYISMAIIAYIFFYAIYGMTVPEPRGFVGTPTNLTILIGMIILFEIILIRALKMNNKSQQCRD